MEINIALKSFDALSQETRLNVFRSLVQAGSKGMLAGEIANALEVRQNTLSSNLSILLNAGLVRNQRQGRTIRYFADFEGLRSVLSFLMKDCCGGNTKLCTAVFEELKCNG